MPYKDKKKKIEYDKKRYEERKEEKKKLANEYYRKNKERAKESQKEYYQKNKEKIKDRIRRYTKKNAEKISKRRAEYYQNIMKKRIENDSGLKIRFRLRHRLWHAMKMQKVFKNSSTLELLGVNDISIVKKHIERMFKPGMSWDNYGKWHIDHIVPLALFDLSKKEQQLKAFRYTNLQPLWAYENLSKGSKVSLKESSETIRPTIEI